MTFLLRLAALAALFLGAASAASGQSVVVHKTPWCGCCAAWVEHLEQHGFAVEVRNHENLTPIKAAGDVPGELHSCHTAFVDGYVIEGHVPAADIARLLAERPEARGLAVPGMPAGSPGMESPGHSEAYEVILFDGAERSVFARH
ncbi:DUF411 domain-containing protein [Marinicauda algicola]|uniref:DUF411 domain-containing protein n=1 Tax=Marinicauda algicola TaxID=2029849 RepID=A0A4S2GZF3_9PROT|nr:DUF411 domain-containing protein [Marinicauda algicola]TGY88597.1 DUF411 domain-containing protein [Marinicauda algicola]